MIQKHLEKSKSGHSPLASMREMPLNEKERRDSYLYNLSHVACKFLLLYLVDKDKGQLFDFAKQNDAARLNGRSPLATNNFFSKFDKIIEQKLAKAAVDTMSDIQVNKQGLAPNQTNAQASTSTISKPYSRKKMVIKNNMMKDNLDNSQFSMNCQ